MYNERMKLTKQDLEYINTTLAKYYDHPEVRKMAGFVAHGKKSVLSHCIDVAHKAYLLNKKFNMHGNEEVLLVGALLHDFYLYDWHNRPLNKNIFKMHGFTHPETARVNAVKYFNVDKDIQKVIKSHMWPLTLRSFPNSKEAFLVCMADKLCALKETVNR